MTCAPTGEICPNAAASGSHPTSTSGMGSKETHYTIRLQQFDETTPAGETFCSKLVCSDDGSRHEVAGWDGMVGGCGWDAGRMRASPCHAWSLLPFTSAPSAGPKLLRAALTAFDACLADIPSATTPRTSTRGLGAHPTLRIPHCESRTIRQTLKILLRIPHDPPDPEDPFASTAPPVHPNPIASRPASASLRSHPTRPYPHPIQSAPPSPPHAIATTPYPDTTPIPTPCHRHHSLS